MQPEWAGEVCCCYRGPQASGREWRLRYLRFHKRHGFLRQTCRINLCSAVRHILRTWAAERLFETSPWLAWVAWIQRGQQTLGTKYLWIREKSFESITDSQLIHPSWQCSSWIVTPDSINHPYQLSELLMSSMSLQRMVGMDSWNKTCPTRFCTAVPHI